MVQTRIRVVQGSFVNTFTVKKELIKVTLKAMKDEIRAGDGDVGDFLKSLELHATAADSAPIDVTLSRDDGSSYQYPFIVISFVVKQDDIKVILEAQNLTEEEGNESSEIVKSLAIHSAGGSDKMVELTMSRADI